MPAEEYINPILSFLISSTFAVLLHSIKRRKKIKEGDEIGINWLIWSFCLWGIVAVINTLAILFGFNNTSIHKVVQAFVSILNSFCYLKAISYIETPEEYLGFRFVKKITEDEILLTLLGIFFIFTIVFLFVKPEIVWIPNMLVSIIALAPLLLKIRASFIDRDMPGFQWLIYVMFFSVLVNEIFRVINYDSKPIFNTPQNIISLFYKIIFCMLILVLLYSWQIKQLIEKSNQESGKYIEANRKVEELTKSEEINREKRQQLTIELENAKQGLNDKIHSSLTFIEATIEFILSTRNYGIIISLPNSVKITEIKYGTNLQPFKRLLKLAIHKKCGKDEKQQTLVFQESYDEDSFTSKDKAKFRELLEASEIAKPVDENIFLEIYKIYQPKHRIGLKVPSNNIILPSLFLNQNKNETPETIYEQFCSNYPFLLNTRG